MPSSMAPQGRGPYGIGTTPSGDVWYASLAGSHIARIDRATDQATVVEPPTANQGARRVWSDSSGRIWVSEWQSGQLSVHDPATGEWRAWRLPGDRPQAYAVYVDERDIVWLTDFGANAIVRFDPTTERFDPIEIPSPDAAVRQLLGRPGEVWGAESATDKPAPSTPCLDVAVRSSSSTPRLESARREPNRAPRSRRSRTRAAPGRPRSRSPCSPWNMTCSVRRRNRGARDLRR